MSISVPTPPRPVLVLLLEDVHALDFAGPVQAIFEANGFGARYALRYVGPRENLRAAQGFCLGQVEPLPPLDGSEWILVPGTESSRLDRLEVPVEWLRSAAERGCRISSICTGAFTLAGAGLLDGRRCTTHWKLIDTLRTRAPDARVEDDRLYTQDGPIVTSAGVASGIDMALGLIEQDHGPLVAAQVAREMVIYVRREGSSEQQSVYLRYRTHLHPGVHRAQDWIQRHPERRVTLEELARLAAVSPRHLSRLFRQHTGTTVKRFANETKLEIARQLLLSDHSIEKIAERCGFRDARQLRRLWREHYGHSLREERGRLRITRCPQPRSGSEP